MTRDEEADVIAAFTQDAWDAWLEEGWLEALEKDLGPLGKRGEIIFQNAWKLGFSCSLSMGRDMANKLVADMDQSGRN